MKTADTLDTVSWFARSLDDVELLFDVVRVRGRNYPYVDSSLVRRPLPVRPVLGIVRGPHWANHTPAAQRALIDTADRLRRSGCFVVEEVHVPEALEIYEAHELIYCKSLAYYFRAEQRSDRSLLSGALLSMLERGEATTPDAYHRAVARQAELTQSIGSRFRHDAWIALSAAGEAPRGLRSPDLPDTCKIWTYLGMPTLGIPVASGPSGLPIGVQIVGPKYADYRVFDVARAMAETLDVRVTIATPNRDQLVHVSQEHRRVPVAHPDEGVV